jgi:hypothetical protein
LKDARCVHGRSHSIRKGGARGWRRLGDCAAYTAASGSGPEVEWRFGGWEAQGIHVVVYGRGLRSNFLSPAVLGGESNNTSPRGGGVCEGSVQGVSSILSSLLLDPFLGKFVRGWLLVSDWLVIG